MGTRQDSELFFVIVRGAQGRAVRVRMVGGTLGVVEVANADGTASVGFPADAVFEDDPALLRVLTHAYAAGDAAALSEAWGRARPWRFDRGARQRGSGSEPSAQSVNPNQDTGVSDLGHLGPS